MHVAAIVRLVPDIAEELEIDESGADIDREWIGFKLGEFDDQALETAVLMKERGGAKVTAVALDGNGADRLLQTAIARGADAAVKIGHNIEDLRSSDAVARAFAKAISDLGIDVVLTGVMTPEDIEGQLAGYLAGHLNVACVSTVTAADIDGARVTVRQEYAGGRSALLDCATPIVLGVQSASQPPRYVAGSKLRQAAATPIDTVATDISNDVHPITVSALGEIDRSGSSVIFEGDEGDVSRQIVDLLAEKSLIGG